VITGKSLADGQLGTAKATLYTVPATTIAHIANIILANAHTAAVTVNLYVKRSGSSSRRIIGKDFSIGVNDRLEIPTAGSAIRLSAGDIIEGDAATGSVIDFLITGGTE
jgi:hypothetical protein